jgi:hypothetical protein
VDGVPATLEDVIDNLFDNINNIWYLIIVFYPDKEVIEDPTCTLRHPP